MEGCSAHRGQVSIVRCWWCQKEYRAEQRVGEGRTTPLRLPEAKETRSRNSSLSATSVWPSCRSLDWKPVRGRCREGEHEVHWATGFCANQDSESRAMRRGWAGSQLHPAGAVLITQDSGATSPVPRLLFSDEVTLFNSIRSLAELMSCNQ